MTDPLKTVRAYWEMAEAAHTGSMRAYARELHEYLGRILSLVGRDEYRCRVCGRANFSENGTTRAWGTFYVWSDGAAFCEEHHAEFDEYVSAQPHP